MILFLDARQKEKTFENFMRIQSNIGILNTNYSPGISRIIGRIAYLHIYLII